MYGEDEEMDEEEVMSVAIFGRLFDTAAQKSGYSVTVLCRQMEPFASEDAHIVEERRNDLIVKFRGVIAKTWEVKQLYSTARICSEKSHCLFGVASHCLFPSPTVSPSFVLRPIHNDFSRVLNRC